MSDVDLSISYLSESGGWLADILTQCSPPSESHSVTLTALARVIITVLNNKALIGSHKVSKLSYWMLYVAVVM